VVSERTAQAVALERSVMLGAGSPAPGSDALVLELSEHLRALLRDIVCGHLDSDVCALADELLAEAAAVGPGPAATVQEPATVESGALSP
jgi:hypothetical protein